MRQWLARGAVVILLQLCAVAAPAIAHQPYTLRLPGATIHFNPASDADLRQLAAAIATSLQTAGPATKHDRRGLEAVARLATAALAATNNNKLRSTAVADLLEAAFAVNNNERPTIPRHFDVSMATVALLQLCRPIGRGETPAANLAPGPPGDLSLRDPLPSTFWTRPADIAAENLSDAFGRSNRLAIDQIVCRYSAPKETAGMNPGFEVECAGQRVKLKFGEVSSEPLAARVFWALGFHADATDYSPGVKVAYDRRIFTEFNSRQPLQMTFTLLWFIPVGRMNLQPRKDPFASIAAAVLRDGRSWTGPELKNHLLAGTNFLPDIEAQIDYLVTVPANVQVRDPRAKTIGPWDYGQLDHAGRRELRGAGLLAAWLGFYDTRFDNTKLRLVGPKSQPQLEHYFSDLGGGLGRTTGFLSWHGEDVNAFPWTFTKLPLDQGKGRLARPLRIVGYTPIVRTPAFAAMTIDDARWIARLIGQLSPSQILAALTASGYDAPTVQLYTRKLLRRRNKMMEDLGLAAEFPPLRNP